MFRLRPVQAQWFETYVPHDQKVRAIEALAGTGAVELESDPRLSALPEAGKLRYFIQRGRTLMARHAEDLPASTGHPTALRGNAVHLANLALHRLKVWSARVQCLKAQLETRRAERQDLRDLNEALRAMRRDGLDLDIEGFFTETRFLCKCLFVCPKTSRLEGTDIDAPSTLLVRGPRRDFHFVLELEEQRSRIEQLIIEHGCEPVVIPDWLSGSRETRIRRIRGHLSALEREILVLENSLHGLRHDAESAHARATLETLGWYLDQAADHLGGLELCHISGWSMASDPDALQHALEAAQIEAVVRYAKPPASSVAPVSTLQSSWTRPFQPLLMLWGVPGQREIDPSGLLALFVPLLFGYMFPDLGHGALIALFALLFGQRWAQIRFLLPCGLAAMGFGLLFGEVMGFDDLLPALWLKPLDEPMLVMGVPLVFGMGLLLLGLVLAGVEARWNDVLRDWLAVEAAVLMLYLALLLALLDPRALWLAAVALPHYLIGSLWRTHRFGPGEAARALARLLFSLFELLLNTLSFARVGAFAMAHAAFSHTIMTLAASVEHPLAWWSIIVLGNLLALVLEGLVVFVQTTRLLLFEFFGHFLRAEGRLFRPVPVHASRASSCH